MEVVTPLGHRQGHDPRRTRSHLLDHGLRVVRREDVLRDGADDSRLQSPVSVLHDQRVQAVLRSHDVLHPPIGGHDAYPADSPRQPLALVHEAIVVHRLVGPMEPADAEVNDARAKATVIARRRESLSKRCQRVRAQGQHR
jgi:hypothetical protein